MPLTERIMRAKSIRLIIGIASLWLFSNFFTKSSIDDAAINTQDDSVHLAGFRASRVNESYPNLEFPSEDYWVRVGYQLAYKLPPSKPASIWIISLYQGNGYTRIGFPGQTESGSFILYSDEDQNEDYLNRFDSEGFKIYLQVEPGNANVEKLIEIVLERYGHHSCIAGFGIDVEWHRNDLSEHGIAVTDSAARVWEEKIKSYNPEYRLFLKHYFKEWMPPSYRSDIIFINDGQGFASLGQLKNFFKNWGDYFSGSKVGFQFGYPADKFWWELLNDPPADIGTALQSLIPNTYGLFWVDFSVTQIFPLTPTSSDEQFNKGDKNFRLSQNYPNPFNPTTVINFELPADGYTSLKVFDLFGRTIKILVEEFKSAGSYEVPFDAGDLPSGVYFYRLEFNNSLITKKMILTR